MKTLARRRPRACESGATAVEAALTVMILLTLILGIIEFGRAVWLYQAVTAASREGARYGISNEAVSAGTPRYRDCDGIRSAAKARTPDLGLTDAQIAVSYLHPSGATGPCGDPQGNFKNGSQVVVTVTRQFDLAVPLVPIGPFAISSTSRRSIYNGVAP